MVIHDLNCFRSRRSPTKADAPLIIDPDRVEAGALAFQSLEPVAWRRSQIGEAFGGMELNQFSQSDFGHRSITPGSLFLPEPSGLRTGE